MVKGGEDFSLWFYVEFDPDPLLQLRESQLLMNNFAAQKCGIIFI